jgi:hypothetical protein
VPGRHARQQARAAQRQAIVIGFDLGSSPPSCRAIQRQLASIFASCKPSSFDHRQQCLFKPV